MPIIVKVAKIGNNLHLRLPMHLCRQESIKQGDFFQVEKDALTGVFLLQKIGNDDGSLCKKGR